MEIQTIFTWELCNRHHKLNTSLTKTLIISYSPTNSLTKGEKERGEKKKSFLQIFFLSVKDIPFFSCLDQKLPWLLDFFLTVTFYIHQGIPLALLKRYLIISHKLYCYHSSLNYQYSSPGLLQLCHIGSVFTFVHYSLLLIHQWEWFFIVSIRTTRLGISSSKSFLKCGCILGGPLYLNYSLEQYFCSLPLLYIFTWYFYLPSIFYHLFIIIGAYYFDFPSRKKLHKVRILFFFFVYLHTEECLTQEISIEWINEIKKYQPMKEWSCPRWTLLDLQSLACYLAFSILHRCLLNEWMRTRSGLINQGTTFGYKSIVYSSTYFSLLLKIKTTYKDL